MPDRREKGEQAFSHLFGDFKQFSLWGFLTCSGKALAGPGVMGESDQRGPTESVVMLFVLRLVGGCTGPLSASSEFCNFPHS